VEEFTDFFSKPPSETGARIAVIRGVGDKYFCAGADLEELGGKSIQEQREGFFQLALLYETIRKSRMITIAAVNGLALGGGCGIAAACDIAVSSNTARFGLPEINLGIAPLIVLMPVMRSIGKKKAFLLAARGRIISAEDALELGLISSVFPQEKLDDEAAGLARDLAGKSGVALSLIKQGVQDTGEDNNLEVYEHLTELLAYNMSTEDAKEGVAAFREKRSPVWKHR
jgi:enoyl-CoA hydratase/carnithine racemase